MENKTAALRFTLSVEVDDEPDVELIRIAAFDMPTDLFAGGLSTVTLPGNGLGAATALAARIACQAIDEALKRHIERGGGSDTPEMLTGLHIDPMADIDKENR